MATKAYACINTNDNVRDSSSSGGIYSLLAEKFISEGGVVFAAIYDEEFNVKHVLIDEVAKIPPSRGAKYVFSDFADSVKTAKRLLEDGTRVMFVGTPCQCAAMLEVSKNYREKLLCVDFVCHGSPDKKAWNAYKTALENRQMFLSGLNMRSKHTGWSNYGYCWEITLTNGRKIYEKINKNPYMKGFVNNYSLMNSCYSCKHKGYERKVDITLGDFWGVWDIKPDFDDNKGTSLVLTHSETGERYFDEIKRNIKWTEVQKDEAIKCNRSIVVPSQKNEKTDIFWKRVDEGEDFINIMNQLEKVSILKKIKYKIRGMLKK